MNTKCVYHGTIYNNICPDCEKADLLKRQAVAIEKQNNILSGGLSSNNPYDGAYDSISSIIITTLGLLFNLGIFYMLGILFFKPLVYAVMLIGFLFIVMAGLMIADKISNNN